MNSTLDPTDVARFRDLVRAETGMAFPNLRAPEFGLAIRRAAADSDAADVAALYGLLAGPEPSLDALDALIGALNVSETYFFRDAGQIQALEDSILPELICRRRPERRLRLWSAGCSTGEEPYTLAILVTRLLADIADWDVLILATDINGRSLERARLGVYGSWSLRGTSPQALTTYLSTRGQRFEVVSSIRAMVTFAQLNLVDDIYPSLASNTLAMDLILCRNVLLYFDEQGGRAVMGRLRGALSDDGRLLVSQVEAGLNMFDGLVQHAPGTAIFHKVDPTPVAVDAREKRAAIAWHRGTSTSTSPSPRPRRNRSPIRRAAEGVERPGEAGDPIAAYGEALQLWRAGQAETALEDLETVIKVQPLAAPLHYLYGLILIDAERIDDALVAMRRCTYADPEFALAHLAQAHLLARMGFRSRARAPLETSARLMADLGPNTMILKGESITVGDVLELITAQRDLLAAPEARNTSRG